MTRGGQTASQTAVAQEATARVAQEATARVTATPQALALIARLRAKHRSIVFFQSGGCSAGSSPICLPEGDLGPGPNDLRLGEIGGCAFYIDADQYERWGRPEFLIDVAPGLEESFSIETPEGLHFISRTAPCGVKEHARGSAA
jgi:uncharacterized protein